MHFGLMQVLFQKQQFDALSTSAFGMGHNHIGEVHGGRDKLIIQNRLLIAAV